MMLWKCLRAVSQAMAAEYGEHGDLFLAAPGELLTIPMERCKEDSNPACQCRRIFVGLSSGQPTTFAKVGVCTARELEEIDSIAEEVFEEDAADLTPLYGPKGIAYAIREFPVGSLVRVTRLVDSIIIDYAWRSARTTGLVS